MMSTMITSSLSLSLYLTLSIYSLQDVSICSNASALYHGKGSTFFGVWGVGVTEITRKDITLSRVFSPHGVCYIVFAVGYLY